MLTQPRLPACRCMSPPLCVKRRRTASSKSKGRLVAPSTITRPRPTRMPSHCCMNSVFISLHTSQAHQAQQACVEGRRYCEGGKACLPACLSGRRSSLSSQGRPREHAKLPPRPPARPPRT